MYSNEHNQSRLRVLKAKEEGVQKLLAEAHKRLSELTKDPSAYKNLLRALIVQVIRSLVSPIYGFRDCSNFKKTK